MIDGQGGKDFEINDKSRMSLSPDPDDDLGKTTINLETKFESKYYVVGQIRSGSGNLWLYIKFMFY